MKLGPADPVGAPIAREAVDVLHAAREAALARADLNAAPQLSAAELRERMSGNICRCGAYSNIVDAITEVAGKPA